MNSIPNVALIFARKEVNGEGKSSFSWVQELMYSSLQQDNPM